MDMKYEIIGLIVVAVLFFGGGYMASVLSPVEIDTTNTLDFNTALAIEYAGGHCERLGLISAVYPQQDEQGNIYGLPVCVEAIQNG